VPVLCQSVLYDLSGIRGTGVKQYNYRIGESSRKKQNLVKTRPMFRRAQIMSNLKHYCNKLIRRLKYEYLF
jgi:hypothetical protein